jgi:eukaryotic-like serine/threonine-protein kinase
VILEAGKIIGERYRLERPLASGGMGHVWVATHLKLDVPVAVKFMSEEVGTSPGGRARFEREAKAVARLQSPHVVRAYDYGLDGGCPYIAMELLEGESLDARLARVERMAPAQAATMLDQIARGLGAAHELGIVHRDLKPGNIFLARAGGEDLVKILDFGVAKETKERTVGGDTSIGTVVGSPHHMSPEQARGGEVDPRSDLWSLAVVLFRCLTGHRLFAGTVMGDVIARICADEIPKPSSFLPTLGADVDAFFAKALARNPAMRFQSAGEMVAAFERAIAACNSAGAPPAAPIDPSVISPRTEETRRIASTAVAAPSEPPPRRRASRLAIALVSAACVAVVAWVSGARSDPRSAPAVQHTVTSRPAASPPASIRAPSAALPASSPTPTHADAPSPPADSAAPAAEKPRRSPAPPATSKPARPRRQRDDNPYF